ncbi:hypothetical protein N0V93_005012 [Gnomoniopsis smithogilvyi]|uniref:Uncharacterized protein n=1 Tax=Gnomoniopsis smithogilvyi TaxID=1191159 RepID=A0A9W8YTR7_9PEZI|nr:hypothetical protein N0V93_005012 [Gnomoniopsis smithogilvyi]
MSLTKQNNAIDAGEGSSSSSAAVATREIPAVLVDQRKSSLPSLLRFPLVAILSFSISSLGYSFINEFTRGELATVMRTLDTTREVNIMTAWRLAELALGWFANFDSVDLAALNFLSHSPTFYLMTAFYNLSPKTALSGLAVDVAASFVPFLLLRSLSDAHKAASSTPNREIILDRSIQLLSILLASFIYNVTLFLSYNIYLRPALVLYFEGIHTIEPSQNSLIILGTLALASGIAARTFIFTPLAATGRTEEDEKHAQFDAIDASLWETFWWNVWGYTTQTKVGIVRTLAVVAVTGINTYVQCALTISGVDGQGAVAYSIVWAAAAFFAAVGLGFVGEV